MSSSTETRNLPQWPRLAFRIGVVVATATVLAIGGAAQDGAGTGTGAGTGGGVRVTEDGAGWDCRTMGNQVCGPVQEGDVTGTDVDGRTMVAHDLNGDGVIAGDVELGA